MFNLREDFGELYSQVNELYPEETKQRISEVISTLIDEGYSDAAITCFFESQDLLSIEEKYISISESYEIPEQNIDRVSSLYQEGWAGRLGKNLLKIGKNWGKSSKNFVTGGKKVAGKVGDDVVKATAKTSKGNTVTGSNWTSGANPAGKPAAKITNDSIGKQFKDTAKAAKQGIKNNPWGAGAVGAVGAGIGLGAITGGEDANKKAMEKLKKDKAELDKQLKGDTTDTVPKTETPKVEKPKDQTKIEKPKTVDPGKKKANVPDGIARGITGAMDLATGNLTDFDQRGGKPIGLARIVTGIADKLTGDRFDFDKRGASKLNAGQKAERDKNYVKKTEKTPVTTPTPDKNTETKKDTGLSFADAIKLANQLNKNKSDKGNKQPTPTNPSGKVLPKPNEVKRGSNRERMISKNVEIHGADKIKSLRNKNAAFQAAKRREGGYTMDDFVKDFPNSNTAKERRQNNKSLHPDLDKALGRKESYEPVLEDYDAYDIVLNYLLETSQANTIEEANYVMLEMDSPTIKGIVFEYAKVNEGVWGKDGKYIDARGSDDYKKLSDKMRNKRKPQDSGEQKTGGSGKDVVDSLVDTGASGKGSSKKNPKAGGPKPKRGPKIGEPKPGGPKGPKTKFGPKDAVDPVPKDRKTFKSGPKDDYTSKHR